MILVDTSAPSVRSACAPSPPRSRAAVRRRSGCRCPARAPARGPRPCPSRAPRRGSRAAGRRGADQVPDLPALDGLRPVQSCGAVRAGACAGRAVAGRPRRRTSRRGRGGVFFLRPAAGPWRHRVWKPRRPARFRGARRCPRADRHGLPSASPTPSQSSTARRATALAMASAIPPGPRPRAGLDRRIGAGGDHQRGGQRGHQQPQAGARSSQSARGRGSVGSWSVSFDVVDEDGGAHAGGAGRARPASRRWPARPAGRRSRSAGAAGRRRGR
jgi:hypothetical protein